MNNILTLFFLSFICLNVNATIRRVNNNASVSSPYATAQAAHDAAVAGDTILVDGSPTSYNSVNCSKQLTWVGNGYFTSIAPFPPFMQNYSTLSFSLNTGSAFSKIIGFVTGNMINLNTNNITISRCFILDRINVNNGAGNISILDCYIHNTNAPYGSILGSPTFNVDNILIANNFIVGGYNGGGVPIVGGVILNSQVTGVNILNNIFYCYQGLPAISIGFGIIKNNIFNNSGNPLFSSNTANVLNNLFMNQTNINYVGQNGNIFVNGSLTASNSVFQGIYASWDDTWMKLKPGSPALSAGENGIDCGVFGGNTPYKLSGVPPIPVITNFQANSIPGNLLPCVLSTRSNN